MDYLIWITKNIALPWLHDLTKTLSFYYYEIGRLLLSECARDFEKPQEVMSILEDIKEVRKEKLMA